MISVFGSQVSPRLMSSLRVVARPGASRRGQNLGPDGVAGNRLLVLSAMLPSDFSIVFQPPIVVGQQHRAPRLPTKMWNVGNSCTGVPNVQIQPRIRFYFRS